MKVSMTALFLVLALPAQAYTGDRSLVVFFGPASEAAGRQAAHTLSEIMHDWLAAPGAAAELRRPGISDGQELAPATLPVDLEKAFLDASGISRQTDLQNFLNALDKATYALARRPGKRLLLVALDSPKPDAVEAMPGGAEEFASRIAQTAAYCQSKSESVLLFDLSQPPSAEPPSALDSLASQTGGRIVRDAAALSAALLATAPPAKVEVAVPAPASAPAGLPIHTRFVRMLQLRSNNAVTDMGPATGMVVAECPIGAFQSRTEGGKFTIEARVTETVRNAQGKSVWEARKDISIKETVKKHSGREKGNIYYVRGVQLPGGEYTVEATVEDLVAGKSGKDSNTLHATSNLPGLAVSDAIFARYLNEAADRFEADRVLAYDGRALAPLLDPVFMANQPFTLRLYFVIYPDLNGAQPEVSLEILNNGQSAGRSQLGFRDVIKNTAGENGTLSGKSEQKHEFPYLTEIRDASFDAGQYEARVTVRQGRNTVTRSVPFRVQYGGYGDSPPGR